MTDSNRSTDPVSLPMDVKRKLLAARDALAVGDLMEAHHQIYSIASPHFNKLADEVWTALETPTPDSPGGARVEQDAARYQFLRSLHDPGPNDPRVHTLDQQHDPVQVRLCFGDDLDAAVDAAMGQP